MFSALTSPFTTHKVLNHKKFARKLEFVFFCTNCRRSLGHKTYSPNNAERHQHKRQSGKLIFGSNFLCARHSCGIEMIFRSVRRDNRFSTECVRVRRVAEKLLSVRLRFTSTQFLLSNGRHRRMGNFRFGKRNCAQRTAHNHKLQMRETRVRVRVARGCHAKGRNSAYFSRAVAWMVQRFGGESLSLSTVNNNHTLHTENITQLKVTVELIQN